MLILSQLRQTGAREFRVVPIGTYHVNRNGRRVADTRGVEYITTPSGKYTVHEWIALMEKAVTAEGQDELLRRIEAHVVAHCAWIRSEKEAHEYALECLSDEAYKAWADFKN